jgi:lysyl-tRNA synthetase class 1
MVSELRDLALSANVWPFEEARKVVARIERRTAKGETVNEVLFETGYGPSGLPHIGTFGEVARTTWVRRAFELMSPVKTRLLAISDDMDGLRKVPDNVPNKELLAANLGKPLTSIPDPFGTHESYGHNMNARLCAFLDRFGFDYEFGSATAFYKAGIYDEALLRVLKEYDRVMEIMLPLGQGAAGEGCRSRYREGHYHLCRGRRQRADCSGDRRALQAAMEARFWHALGGAWRRLRNVRQGSPAESGTL